MPTPSLPSLVAEAGRLLYGEAWQGPLSRGLGLNLRTVQRIAAAAGAGEPYPVAPGVLDELAGLLIRRSNDCERLATALQDRAARGED